MSVFAYIRVSTDKQDLENQRFTIMELCNAEGINLDRVVQDKKSGKVTWRERDIYALIQSMNPGDLLITPELSRLSRSLQDVFDLLAECARRKVTVRVIKGGFVVDGSLQSTVLVTAFGLAAQIEREFISQRTKEALARRKSEGKPLGRPKGTRPENTKLKAVEAEVRNMIKLDVPATKIAKKLANRTPPIVVCATTIRRFKEQDKARSEQRAEVS